MLTLTAQELKQGGISKIKSILKQTKDFIIQERGKNACVVVDIEYFNELKLCELEVAYLKAQQEINNGEFETITDVESHVKNLLQEIDLESNPKVAK